MANLSQLQMPSIDTGQLSGKDGKKIKSYLFQIQEMLRYALNDIDEDNLSEELRSKIESGGLSSEISQALDAITLRVTGLDDAQAELKLTAEGLTEPRWRHRAGGSARWNRRPQALRRGWKPPRAILPPWSRRPPA